MTAPLVFIDDDAAGIFLKASGCRSHLHVATLRGSPTGSVHVRGSRFPVIQLRGRPVENNGSFLGASFALITKDYRLHNDVTIEVGDLSRTVSSSAVAPDRK